MADGLILLQKDNTFTKLFVGGLPYHTTDETLRAFFSQYGDIEEAVVIYDKNTRKSKGYGFVTMADKEGAERACQTPNPIVDGRKANVNLAYLGAKPKNHGHAEVLPGDFGYSYLLSRNETDFAQQSPPPPMHMQGQAFFQPLPPPGGFYDGSPPFSPPPMLPPFLYPPYYNQQFGYAPPHASFPPQSPVPSLVPYNMAN